MNIYPPPEYGISTYDVPKLRNVVIFGAGQMGRECMAQLSSTEKLLCFLDNNQHKQEHEGYPVYRPACLPEMEFDAVYLAIGAALEGKEQLLALGVDEDKIILRDNIEERNRVLWLEYFSQIVSARGLAGNVAEAGVFRGEFAKHLNAKFPGKTLYLFDTFDGFSQKDIDHEQKQSLAKANVYDNTSVEIVLGKMPFPEKCVVKPGRFPESAQGIEDSFILVNLDMDLYKPTLEGLRFFWNKMVPSGVILVHDYFNPGYPNVPAAVFDFEKETGMPLNILPIADKLSVAIVK